MNGAGGSAIVGGDWPNPLPITTYSEPTRRPTGLDWSKHTAPDPEPVAGVDDGTAGPEHMPATRAEAYTENTEAHEEARERVERVESRQDSNHPPRDYKDREPTEPELKVREQNAVLRLLGATADATDPAVVSARQLVVEALQHLRLVATSTPPQAPPARPREPKTKPKPKRTGRPRANTQEIVDAYLAGNTIVETGVLTGHDKGTVRRHLIDAGVQLRDDRSTNSGGNNRYQATPEQIEDVRRLYIDERLSQARVAEKLGIPQRRVSRIMERNGIPAREGQSGGGDTLGQIRTRLHDLGVKSTDVRAWARQQGLDVSTRGVIPLWVLDRYEQHHA